MCSYIMFHFGKKKALALPDLWQADVFLHLFTVHCFWQNSKKLNLTYDSLKTFNYSEIQNWNPKIQHKSQEITTDLGFICNVKLLILQK